jgi:polyferredoxin
VLRPRLVVYAAIMLASLVTLTVSLVVRTPFEANVLRPRGASPWMVDGEVIRNAFEVHLINKGPESSRFHITATSPVPATIFVGTPDVLVGSLLDTRVPVSVSIDSSVLTAPVDVKLTISDSASGKQKEQLVRFLAPLTRR